MREKMQRFDLYMKIKGLNDNQVTLECGLSQGLLGQARTGKSDLGQKTLEKILNTYQDLNKVWLLTGEGAMLIGDVNGNNNAVGKDATVNINESETISNLISVIKKEQEQKDRMLSIIEDLTSKIK